MGDLEAHATLAEDESYVACVALVKEKEYSGCKEVHGHFPEINAYGPGLSAWFEVYKAASGALRGRSSKAFMAVVNAFLAEWAGLEKGSYFQGFSYQPETVSFAVDAEVWGGLDEGFRRDFQAARQMFGYVDRSLTLSPSNDMMLCIPRLCCSNSLAQRLRRFRCFEMTWVLLKSSCEGHFEKTGEML